MIKHKRGGFSLLETIFAIVIISIILTPIPALLSSIGDSAKVIGYKDAIFSAMSKSMQLTLYRWDEFAKTKYGEDKVTKILETNSSSFGRSSSNPNTRNYGKGFRIFFDNSETNKTLISASGYGSFKDPDEGNDSILYDDIDDWHQNSPFYDIRRGDKAKSIDFNITYNVFYIDDDQLNKSGSHVTIVLDKTPLSKITGDENRTSNLKFIEVQSFEKNSNDKFEFYLHYISSNIGDMTYDSKIIY
jgi:prepilin-type N-terminal cleavage/methylation domain-containing protein